MAYLSGNPKSKADVRRRLAAGEVITVYQPGLGSVPRDGKVCVEGPHYPQAHTWYGEVTVVDGKVVKIK